MCRKTGANDNASGEAHIGKGYRFGTIDKKKGKYRLPKEL